MITAAMKAKAWKVHNASHKLPKKFSTLVPKLNKRTGKDLVNNPPMSQYLLMSGGMLVTFVIDAGHQ